MKLAVLLFRFFASLQLAIVLLVLLGLVFAVGTFTESAYGTEAAKLLVYQNPLMSILLILLALNVAAAALDRLPWKKKHVGFVITHAGIILLLAGALITRAYGIEGQMAVQEGQTASRIILRESLLQIFSEDAGFLRSLSLPSRAFAWQGRESLDPDVYLLQYYPKASRKEKIEEAVSGSPALHVFLQNSFMNVDHWLVLEDPERAKILLGPATLHFTKDRMTPTQESAVSKNFLEFQFKDKTLQVPIGENQPTESSLEGTPYKIKILRILPDAVVEQAKLVNRSQQWNNPACELILEGNGIHETHTVFSKFPDFPTMHGMKPSEAGVRILLHVNGSESEAAPKNELRFVWRENGPPLYQVRKGDKISEGKVAVGEETETGWMDFKFKVAEYYPHAQMESRFKEEPVNSQSDEHLSAIQLEFHDQGEPKQLWLGQGDHQEVKLGGKTFEIVYGLRTQPLGFRLVLKDFKMEKYPGTSRPASFESDVTLKDDSSGLVRDVNIHMNHPLTYRGYKIFQSGYQQPEGEPEISVFTVAKDPGIPLKYFGAIVLIGGIITMFYTRRFSSRPSPELKEVVLR